MRAAHVVLVGIAVLTVGCSSDTKSGGLTQINGPAVANSPTTVVSTAATEPSEAPPSTPATAPATTSTAQTSPSTTTPISTPGTSAIGPYASAIYSDPANWLCRPDKTDVCDESLPVSEIAADGTVTERPYTVATDPPIDCFYVYPTSSEDSGINSDFVPGDETTAAEYQVASFNQLCKIYAPMYRSVTRAGLSQGLSGSSSGDFAAGWQLAYGDVLDAWKSYLANDNHGRPVVIISHSQGSFHVTTLLNQEIDPNPAERGLIVSVIMPGASFQVAPGHDVGGTTQNIPLCRADGQFGCVISYSMFPVDSPPHSGSLFGAPQGSTEGACTNPAALAGGSAMLSSAMPTARWVPLDASAKSRVTTKVFDAPGLFTGECMVKDGYHYLAITYNAHPNDALTDTPPPQTADNWGYHTFDINMLMGDLLDDVRAQTAAYLAAR